MTEINLTIENKVTIALALRARFTEIQHAQLKQGLMDDSYLLKRMRRAQDQYQLFRDFADEIEEENRSVYEREILGL